MAADDATGTGDGLRRSLSEQHGQQEPCGSDAVQNRPFCAPVSAFTSGRNAVSGSTALSANYQFNSDIRTSAASSASPLVQRGAGASSFPRVHQVMLNTDSYGHWSPRCAGR